MTNLTEAKLAREAESRSRRWRSPRTTTAGTTEHGDVTVEEVIRVLQQNVSRAKETVRPLPRVSGTFENPQPRSLSEPRFSTRTQFHRRRGPGSTF
jgi:hypothetical protein